MEIQKMDAVDNANYSQLSRVVLSQSVCRLLSPVKNECALHSALTQSPE